VTDPTTAATKLAQGGEASQYYSPLVLPHFFGYPIALDLPAVLIVAAVTVILIYGIRESATTNTTIVLIKVAVVIFVIAFGSFMVHPANWQPFAPSGFGGIMGGAAIVFFAFIGFDAVSTTAEETKNRNATCRSHDRQPDHLHAALRADVSRADGDKENTWLSSGFSRGGNGLCQQNVGPGARRAGASPAFIGPSSSNSATANLMAMAWMVCRHNISPASIPPPHSHVTTI
jgi:hypothetical protein